MTNQDQSQDQDQDQQTSPTSERLSKADLLARMDAARSTLEQIVARSSEAQLTTPGPEGWSVKDHLDHLARWEQSAIALLSGKSRPAAVGVDTQTWQSGSEPINLILQERSKGLSLADVLAELRRSRAELQALLTPLTDDDLYRPYAHYLPDEDRPDKSDPVINWITGDTFEHDEEHLPWIEALLK